MATRRWALIRLAVAATVLVLLVHRLGAEPFLTGLRAVDAQAVGAAVLLTALATWCCAARWRAVSGALGVPVPWSVALPAYYRSQLMNATLPAGVLGDVHRALDHGQRDQDRWRAARGVAWERNAGQVVQLGITLGVVVLLPSAFHSLAPWLVTAFVLIAVGLLLLRARRRSEPGATKGLRSLASVAAEEIRRLSGARTAIVVVATSALALAAYVAIFLVALRTAGVEAGWRQALPMAVVVLLAAAVPLNLGGWGPREGAAAWVFATAGFGAAAGVTVAVVYGVISFLGVLPGLVVLVADGVRPPPRVSEVTRA